MRVDDYRFYGQICFAFGIILLLIGIALPIVTAEQEYYIFSGGFAGYEFPYLTQGIILSVLGVILIVISQISYREWRLRSAEQPPLPPPPQLS